MKLVNDDEIAKNVLYEWLTFARTYSNAVNGVLQLRKALRRQDNETINIVECIAKYYKGLSREERLEFSKRIAEASDLDNSLDSLKYQWSK